MYFAETDPLKRVLQIEDELGEQQDRVQYLRELLASERRSLRHIMENVKEARAKVPVLQAQREKIADRPRQMWRRVW